MVKRGALMLRVALMILASLLAVAPALAGERDPARWLARSEERRVGKECYALCRSRWSPYH